MYRIMIADDEEIECRALELMVRNHFSELEIVPEAHNGIELLANLERYKPDIAIVDINMPGLNGLEALEIIRMKNRRLKIMIHTAYSDFEFSQRALKLGVEEYILKPVTQDEFAAALRKIVLRLKEENTAFQETEKMLKISQDMQLIVGDQILTSFILKEAEEKNFRIYCQALNHPFTGAVFCMMRMEAESDYHMEAKLRQVREIADIQLQKFTNYVIRIYQGEIYILLLPGAHVDENNYEKWAENIFEIILKKAGEITEEKIMIGCSKWKTDFQSMQYGINECRLQLKKPGKKERISFYHEEKPVDETDTAKQIFEELLILLKNWEKNKQKAETQIFEKMKSSKLRLPDQAVLCSSVLLEWLSQHEKRMSVTGSYHADCIFDWKILLNPDTEEQLRQCFHESLEKTALLSGWEEPVNLHVERTILYLEEKYSQDITLEMAAENTGITPFYLSRLLRQELDRTFVEILTEIRMRKAMSLLQNKMVSVKDTAALVGFQNYTYFYKSFKKYTGISVGEYRASFFDGKEK